MSERINFSGRIGTQQVVDILDAFIRRFETQRAFDQNYPLRFWDDFKIEEHTPARIFIKASEYEYDRGASGQRRYVFQRPVVAIELFPHELEITELIPFRDKTVEPPSITTFAGWEENKNLAAQDDLEYFFGLLVDYLRAKIEPQPVAQITPTRITPKEWLLDCNDVTAFERQLQNFINGYISNRREDGLQSIYPGEWQAPSLFSITEYEAKQIADALSGNIKLPRNFGSRPIDDTGQQIEPTEGRSWRLDFRRQSKVNEGQSVPDGEAQFTVTMIGGAYPMLFKVDGMTAPAQPFVSAWIERCKSLWDAVPVTTQPVEPSAAQPQKQKPSKRVRSTNADKIAYAIYLVEVDHVTKTSAAKSAHTTPTSMTKRGSDSVVVEQVQRYKDNPDEVIRIKKKIATERAGTQK